MAAGRLPLLFVVLHADKRHDQETDAQSNEESLHQQAQRPSQSYADEEAGRYEQAAVVLCLPAVVVSFAHSRGLLAHETVRHGRDQSRFKRW